MRLLERLRFYLQDESGFLGLGGDKVTRESSTIGKADKAYIEQIRQQGANAADVAKQSGPWAPGWDPYQQGAMARYGTLGDQYWGAAQGYGGMAQDAYGGAMQTGLAGLAGYANPYAQMQIDAMAPTWDYQRQLASSQGQLAGNAPGVSHSQQARSALLEAELLGGVNRAQTAYEGDVWGQAGAQGMQAMLADRARMAGLGQGLASSQFAGLSGYGGVAGALGQLGADRQRTLAAQRADPFLRNQAGLDAMRGAYMGPTEQYKKNVEEGSVFGDLMSMAGMGVSLLGGGGAGKLLSGLFGGGGPKASPSLPVPQATFASPSVYDYNVPGARPVFAPQYPG